MELIYMEDTTLETGRAKVLIVEDNESLALGLRESLAIDGYDVTLAGDGELAMTAIDAHDFDLLILDLSLPKLNGFEVLKRLRRAGSEVLVLVLTARDQEVDKVQGFRLGADDYVVKPVGVLELLARVEALLRRAPRKERAAVEHAPRLGFGDVVVEEETRSVRRNGHAVELSPLEFDLLLYLVRADGRVVSRDALMRYVWKYATGVASRTIDQHIARLRHKLEPEPLNPRHILTVRKAGYRIEK